MKSKSLMIYVIIAANALIGTGCSSLQSLSYVTKSPSEMTQEERELDKNIADVIDIINDGIITYFQYK